MLCSAPNQADSPSMALPPPTAFWSLPGDELLRRLDSSPAGLTPEEARARLGRYGANALKPQARTTGLALLLSQYKSPIILLLLFAAALSFYLREHTDALIARRGVNSPG
jgi:Mg2+-importing ATPase